MISLNGSWTDWALKIHVSIIIHINIKWTQDMCVINDPLGQTHSPISSDQSFQKTFVLWYFEKWGRTRVKIMITDSRDGGSANWINWDLCVLCVIYCTNINEHVHQCLLCMSILHSFSWGCPFSQSSLSIRLLLSSSGAQESHCQRRQLTLQVSGNHLYRIYW